MQTRFWRRYKLIIVLIMGVGSGSFNPTSHVLAVEAPPPHVTLILLDGLSQTPWLQLQGLLPTEWVEQSQVAGVNLRTARGYDASNVYLGLGAGKRGYAPPPYPHHHYERDEYLEGRGMTAEAWQLQLWGQRHAGAIFSPGIVALQGKNGERSISAHPGRLGTILREAGARVALYGSLDTGEERLRNAPLITMDETGMTPVGNLRTEVLVYADAFPGGWRTDYTYLRTQHGSGRQQFGLTVIQLGDWYRLSKQSEWLAPERLRQVESTVLGEMAQFIQWLLETKKENESIMLFSHPYQTAPSLGLFQFWQRSGAEEGRSEGAVLTSPSTRQPGIILHTDITATILQSLRLKQPAAMTGEPVQGVSEGVSTDERAAWLADMELIQTIYAKRGPLLSRFIVTVISLLLLTLFILWRRVPLTAMQLRALLAMLWATLLVPTLLLWDALWIEALSPWLLLLILFLIGSGIGWWMGRLPLERGLLWVTGSNLFFLLVVAIYFPQLLQRSSFSYDPMIGARFYGLGNEYMGMLVGCGILLLATLFERSQGLSVIKKAGGLRWGSMLGLALLLFLYLAWPTGGSNAGGAITALVGFSFTFWYLGAWGWKRALPFLGGGLVLFLLFITLHLFVPVENESHIGRMLRRLSTGELSYVWELVQRKWGMNWRLIRVSMWSRLFVVSLFIFLFFSFDQRTSWWRSLHQQRPFMGKGMASVLVASIVTLLVNDSGVVAAAIMLLYAVVPLLVMKLVSRYRDSPV